VVLHEAKVGEIPNSKHQAPNSKQTPSTKFQTPNKFQIQKIKSKTKSKQNQKNAIFIGNPA
jgi:hypothetical protein